MYDTQNPATMESGKLAYNVHIGQFSYSNALMRGSNAPHIVTYNKPLDHPDNWDDQGDWRNDSPNGPRKLCEYWLGRDARGALIPLEESFLIGRIVAFKIMGWRHPIPSL